MEKRDIIIKELTRARASILDYLEENPDSGTSYICPTIIPSSSIKRIDFYTPAVITRHWFDTQKPRPELHPEFMEEDVEDGDTVWFSRDTTRVVFLNYLIKA